MPNERISRVERYHLQNKKPKKRHGCLKFLLVVIVLLLAGGFWVYSKVKDSVDQTYENTSSEVDPHDSRKNKKISLKRGDAFSVLLLGVDTGEYGRVEKGRSDSMMLMTLNPKENQTVITSIPRDSLVPIIGHGTEDKINHAYAFGGPAMSINTVQSFLDVPVDYYVAVNMAGIEQIVDAVNGITITPRTTFTQGDYTFYEGEKMHMNGSMALEYSRMRKDDGDYARQQRQREVVQAIMDRLISIDGITNYQSVLKTMENNVKTNMSFDEMIEVSLNYRKAAEHIENDQLQGEGTMIDGIYYEVYSDEEISRVSHAIKTQLNIE